MVLRADGSFLAPAENCEREGNAKCKWWTEGEQVLIRFGNAGVHTLRPDDEHQMMSGYRDSDGDQVTAERR